MDSRAGTPSRGGVAPFGDPRIEARSRLPGAYRSVPRPSSPLDAKASTRCPSLARPAPAAAPPGWAARPPQARGRGIIERSMQQHAARRSPPLSRRDPSLRTSPPYDHEKRRAPPPPRGRAGRPRTRRARRQGSRAARTLSLTAATHLPAHIPRGRRGGRAAAAVWKGCADGARRHRWSASDA